MLKIGVLISGGGSNLQSIIDAVESKKIKGEIAIVISNKKDAYGLQRAQNHGIKNYWIDDEKQIIEMLNENKVDLIVLAGYLKILSEDFIKQYNEKIINIHPSLIPSFCGPGYYGIKVHQEVYKKGVKITGATTHFVNEKADEGPIILQRSVEIKSSDSVEDIQKKVLEIEHQIMVESVRLYCENRLNIEDERVIILE